MNEALEVIKAIEASGGRITVEGDNLVIAPRRAGIPLLPRLREHKPEILALLQSRARDPERAGCPGPDACAGCYSVGVVDGVERFIHPPKSSPEWGAWLQRWRAEGRVQ